MATPYDEFTPHGYLDNPYHSWKLNPSGVLRSSMPLGMGWHVPNLASYARNQFQYAAHLAPGFKIGKTVLITPEDFKRHHCTITGYQHTKNRFGYICQVPKHHLTIKARFFLIAEHALGCILTLLSDTAQTGHAQSITCYFMHHHTHNPHTSRLWEHGLYAIPGPQEGTCVLGLASEGDAFVHGARPADGGALQFGAMGFVVAQEDAAIWAHDVPVTPPNVTEYEESTGWQIRTVIQPCTLTLEEGAERIINVVLARGVSQDQAYQYWLDGMEEIARAEAEHRSDDEQFWEGAPQLSGDWPEHWRRGIVYDFETLRMVMRPSAGVVDRAFDGMQIQAPRLVLAEAAMDALFLSYANPALAAEVMLCHFETAPRPNLPCMREDGSYNMIADDGQICGTAPEWGFPIYCCDQLFRRTGDLAWLRRLYPGVTAYLRWWLEHRRDHDGWLVYACSWESGQDVSSRFGSQQTGGTIIQHVRPVDLQASMAQAANIVSRWATLLSQEEASPSLASNSDFPAEAAWWKTIADEFTAKTQAMWHDGWFRDYDAVTGEWSTQQDTMHLAPVFCEVSTRETLEQVRPYLARPPKHSSGWAPLSWPPVVMTIIGAALAADMLQDAAELAYRYIDASYRSTDRREPDEHGGLPGVTREYLSTVIVGKWDETDYRNAGIEGYGWGALSVYLLLHCLLGMQAVEANCLIVRPVLPEALRRPGAAFNIAPVPWGNHSLALQCTIIDAQHYRLVLDCTTPSTIHIAQEEILHPASEVTQPSQTYQHIWEATWGEGRVLHLPALEERVSFE